MTAALSYAIDENDRLVQVDEGFRRFGAENGWPEAGSSLGRLLWDYVAGHEPRKLQRLLLRRVRDEGLDLELPFRCDGPDVRRDMTLRIAARPSGRVVLFSSRLSEERPREVSQPLLDLRQPRGEEAVEMCAWCDRFQVDGEWVEVEEAALRLELFGRSELPAIGHGICSECNRLLLAA